MTQNNLGSAFLSLFDRTTERPHLDAALEAVEEALEEYRKARAEYHIEEAEPLRADILSRMG
jgi:hypothetical protein